MRSSRLMLFAIAVIIVLLRLPGTASAYIPYESHVFFVEALTQDVVKLIPRAMGNYIFQNRYDYFRGMTFMTRNKRGSIYKNKDLEEIRREAYERLMRDVPYCVEALKGGELKLDSSDNNVAGRLGLIAYHIMLLKYPEFPDLAYYEAFSRGFEEAINENLVDIWVHYDGYGDFACLGDLMERLKQDGMPDFRHVRNKTYPPDMKKDLFSMFRPPEKFEKFMITTNVDINQIYSNMINDIVDAFMFIWKCSGMELAHPSYSAPPGTMLVRNRRGSIGMSAGALARPSLDPIQIQQQQAEQQQAAQQQGQGGGVSFGGADAGQGPGAQGQ